MLEDRGIFKCFGCGKGGDAFTFVMEMEALTFPEAIRKLAERAHIEIEGTEAAEDEVKRSDRESILNALREAAAFYYRSLRSPIGEEARNYLHGRHLYEDFTPGEEEKKKKSVQEKFGLGFAPDRSGILTEQLTSKGIDLERLERAGIIARRDTGEHYERFRGRIMFPVFNHTGRIVGFGGRILPADDKKNGVQLAKYINSPDTEVYHKSQILYGLFQAKDAIRKAGFAILVEGYADVLAVFQSGTENVVAASGTSLTTEQLQLLRRYSTNIVLLFDADTAGKNATMRGIELAIEAGFDVSTVILPSGEDPDSFIRLNGSEAFESAVEHRQTFIETKAQIFEEQGAFRDPGRMAGAIRSIVETIAKVPDAIKRALFIQKLGERFHLSEQMLSTELTKHANNQTPRERRIPIEDDRPISQEEEMEPNLQTQERSLERSEAALLEAMLAEPERVAQLIESSDFSIDMVPHLHVRELLSYFVQRVEEEDIPTIAELLDEYRGKPEFEELLTRYGMSNALFSSNWDEHAETEGIRVLEARQAIEELQRGAFETEQRKISALVRSGNDSDDYLRKIMELHERPEVKKKFVQQISEEESGE